MEALSLGGLLLLLQHAQANANATAIAAKGEALEGLRCVLPRYQAVVLHAIYPKVRCPSSAGVKPMRGIAEGDIYRTW